ncbi:hypothetical protein ACFWCF_12575 [Rhodococcus sp. NPDC060090]|uniref:hypothetical protein n=1 Tax=Rhodococcus sp. NPDC060090 TaxID=3347056 RepID=UPI0036667B95
MESAEMFRKDRYNRLGENEYRTEVRDRRGRAYDQRQFDRFEELWREAGRRPSFLEFFDKQ